MGYRHSYYNSKVCISLYKFLFQIANQFLHVQQTDGDECERNKIDLKNLQSLQLLLVHSQIGRLGLKILH
ncbi:hypothetical protein DXC86_12165 [Bacteroides fragilis]|nr:hypothetical protein DXC86_12165 [Bacteroides fragilis]